MRGNIMAGKKWTEEDLNTLKEMYASGLKVSEIAKLFDRSEDSIRIKANRSGLKRHVYTLETLNTKIAFEFPQLSFTEFDTVKSRGVVQNRECKHSWVAYPTHILVGKCTVCPVCNKTSRKKTTESFWQEIIAKYANSTSIIKVSNYTSSKEYVDVMYSCGHNDAVIAGDLLIKGTKKVCRVCIPQRFNVKSKETFEKEVLQISGKDIVVLEEYVNDNTYLSIKDTKCGHTWKILPHNYLSKGTGYRCYECNPYIPTEGTGISKVELELKNFIASVYHGWVEYNDRSILKGKELDIVIPDLGLAIEFNGVYWHSEVYKDKAFHYTKTLDTYNEIEYTLVHIFENDWYSKQDIIKSMLKQRLGIQSNKIYARKCTIERIDFPKVFLNENHIQGAGAPTGINYGLFHSNALVATMTFGPSRFDKTYEYELIRYCVLKDTTVVGGASKLFKRFIKEFTPISLISYSNFNYGRGKLYETLGFKYVKDTGPDYYYIKGRQKVSRYKAMKQNIHTIIGNDFNPKLTEAELMKQAGWLRVYTAGSQVFSYGI